MPNNITQPTVFIPTFDGLIEHGGFDTTQYAGQIGSRVTIKDPNGKAKSYQRVLNDSSTANLAAESLLAFWADRKAYRVTMHIADSQGRGATAGVYRNNDAAGVGTLNPGDGCFIQTQGESLVTYVNAPTSAPTAASLIVIPSATDGQADCLAAGTAATYPPIGVSAGTQNGTTKQGLVDLSIEPQP